MRFPVKDGLSLSVAAQNVNDLVTNHALESVTGIGKILAGIKVIGMLIEVLTEAIPNIRFETLKTDYDTESQLWLDSFTTVMSIITMYISVKAFVEQWYMWLIINVAYIFMWLMSDSEFSFMTVAKYSVYFVNSFYGIYMWDKLSKK
mgnify:CR=1 FL=1